MDPQDDFLRRLRATFALEAEEHLEVIANGLLELEKSLGPDAERPLIEKVFRAAHSLKGAARAVDFTDIETHCASLEDTFATWKRQQSTLSPAALEALHRTLDAIRAALAGPARAPAGRAAGPPSFPRPDKAPPAPLSDPQGAGERALSPGGTVRIAVAKLDARLLDAEEMLTAKLILAHRAEALRDLASRAEVWKREWAAVEPDARALWQAVDRPSSGSAASVWRALGRMLEHLNRTLAHLKSVDGQVTALARAADLDRQVIGRLIDDLLEDSKRLLLMPFATLVAPLRRLVRDLCRDVGKAADLVIQGEHVELDKRILEQMKDPLLHLLRNAVDHGIEMPEQRQRAGKPARGTITVAASQVSSTQVEIVVSDDGQGIDIDRVKASAIERGVLSEEDAGRLSDSEASGLIFQADVSASPIITRLSGRGLGLAIVRERAEELGGTVSVESRRQQGVRFSIVLPSALATFRGVLVEAAGCLLVVPSMQVERVARIPAEDIRTVEGRETIVLAGRAVSFVRLADVLHLPRAESAGERSSAALVIVLGSGDQRIACMVDAVLDEQEVLVKPFRRPLSRVRNIAGATVLGSGQVALILGVGDLLKSARTAGAAVAVDRAAPRADDGAGKSILVAEDSITSRMLIKGILESAGYAVRTAVDGLDAFTQLRAERFDLLVSDVEMPRLNGFDLAARIRADPRLSELPVVLVTALETTEDRARGIDVGADAYIVKSSFDQSDLLDAVRRLV